MTPNPPIPGHELLHEGGWFRRSTNGFYRPADEAESWSGGCRCGEKPEGAPLSNYATRRWHRQHKADLRLLAEAANDADA
jgi:hypothetical protein